MRQLSQRKTKLIFETADTLRECGRTREVVLEAKPLFAVVRLKGNRKSYPISWAAIYHAAARIESERLRAEKRAKRKG